MKATYTLLGLVSLVGCGGGAADDGDTSSGGGSAGVGDVSVAASTVGVGAGASVTGAGGQASATSTGGQASGGGQGGGQPSGGGQGGGEGGGPPPVVTQCDEIDVAGQWENVTPPQFLDPPNLETWSVAVNPLDGILYAAAGNITAGCGGADQPACIATGIYRSDDCGASWALASTGDSSEALHTGNPWAMIVDPTDSDVVYVNNGYGNNPTLYKSTNGGVDFEALNPDPESSMQIRNFVQAVAMSPSDPRHLVVSFHDNCTAPYNPNCLSETKDGGATWRLFNGPEELEGWAEAASVGILGPSSYLYATPAGWGGFFTSDGGATWTKVLEGAAYGSYGGGAILDAEGNAYLGVGGSGIFVSRASSGEVGASWTLLPGSPQASVVATDGVRLYANYLWDAGDDPLHVAPLAELVGDEPAAWANTNTSGMTGVNMLEYDASHRIMYGASPGSGVWRYATTVSR